MINIALIRNPIQPDRREEHNTEFAGQSLQTLIAPILADWPDTEFVVSVNGGIIEKDDVVSFYPADGDYIVLMPQMGKGFGDILRTMLMVALMIWAPALGAQWATTAGIVNTTMAGIYTGVITMAGGLILNAILPPSAQDSSTETSTSYGWQGSGITEIPGTPVGRTYGTVSPTLVRLQRHITTDGENQYLNVLYSAGGGSVDSIQDITIGGNPIANYDDVEYWIRLGTNDQDVIENFSDTYSDYSLSYELDDDSEWHTQRTEGTGVEGLEIMLVLPGGLFYTTDKGSLATATVKIDAQYKLASSETWIDWLTTETISDKKSEAIFKSFRKDHLTAGQYDVRTRCTYKSGTTTRYSTRIAWSQLSEIMYDDFVYPNKVLLGIRIKATDQLSGGDPEVKCTVTRSNVWVWNPYTAAYVQKRASNPYWAAYDLLHKCELLKNIQTGANEYSVDGFPARRFDYDKYAEYGAYADELVDGDYRFVLNIFIEGNIKMMDALNRISAVGRGVILPRGTKFSCLCDMPTSMTHIFTDGNITNGTMQGEWQSVENRSRSVEVSFWNKEKNYTKDMAIYLSDEYNEDGMVPNPTQVTYYGITDYAHAYREAAFLARCNKYKERTKSWQADIDAIPCVIGDVVGVQTQTSNWGNGGRIVSATLNTVTLDQEVTLAAGTTYKIYVRLEDDTLVQKTIVPVSVDTSTRVLAVTEAFASIPKQFDLYALGTAIAKMKVLSIVRADDQKAKITAEQYFEEIYSDTVTVPDINYSDYSVKALTVTAAEVLPRPSLSTQNVLVTWNGPRDPRASITKIFANGVIKDTDFGNTFGSKKIQLSVDPAYSIRVDVTDSLGNLVATGKISHTSSYAVPHVTGLAVAQAYRETGSTLSYELSVSWIPPSPEIYAAADVYLRSNLATAEEIGELDDAGMAIPIDRLGLDVAPWKQIGSGYDKFAFPGAVKGATYKFMALARDTNGVSADESTAPTVEYTVAVKPYTPVQPSGLTLSVSDKPYCAWNANTDTDIDFYELRTDANYGVDTGRLFKGSAVQCNPVLASRTGTLYLFAHNPSGHYSPALSYSYSFQAPAAPTVTITDVFQGFIVSTNALPTSALGISVHINTAIYKSPNNTYKYSASAGIYDVSVAFYDYFGEGVLSAVQNKTILIYIDPAWVEAESLSLAMMDTNIKTAWQTAVDAAPMSTVTTMQAELAAALLDISAAESAITAAQNTISGISTALDAAELAITVAQTTISGISTDLNAAELAITTAQTDIDAAELAIISAQGRLTAAEGSITTHSAAITELDSEILLKANSTTVSAIDGRLITAEGSISTQAGQIALKAAQTTVDTLAGRVTTAEGSITTIAGQVAIKASQTDVDTIAGRVTSAESGITVNTSAIALKANSTTVDTLAGRVTTAEGSITTQAGQIALKAAQTTVDTLAGRVTTAESTITTQAGQIALKAATTTVDTLAGRVTTAEGSITTQAGQLVLKASTSTVDTLTGRVASAEASISTISGQVALKAATTTVDAIDGRVDTAEAELVVQAGQIATKASSSSVSALDTRLSSAETTVTQNTNAIALKAAQTTVDTLAGRVTTAEGSITTIAGQVAIKAAQTDVDTLAGRVTTTEGNVTTISGQIALKASQSSMDTLAGRVTSAEGSITTQAGQIALRVTQTDFNALSGTVSGHTTTIGVIAGSITSITTELGKDIDECSYAAIIQAYNGIEARVVKGDVIARINLGLEGTVAIGGAFVHITGDTLFDNNVIVAGMITSGNLTLTGAMSIKNTAGTVNLNASGLKLTESDGAYTMFNPAGITWYDSAGTPHGAIKRMVSGVAVNGQYVRFGSVWRNTPLILLAPQEFKTLIAGSTAASVQCFASNISNAGFTVNLNTVAVGADTAELTDVNDARMTTNGDTRESAYTTSSSVTYLRGLFYKGGTAIARVAVNPSSSVVIGYWVQKNGGNYEKVATHTFTNPQNDGFPIYSQLPELIFTTAIAGQYRVKIVMESGAGSYTPEEITYYNGPQIYDINVISRAQTIIDNAGSVDFIAIESDANNYYSLE